jgi:hypothetical protein
MVMATPFDPQQKEISDKVHLTFRDILYPTLFKVKPEAIAYDVLPESFRADADRHIAIDCFMDITFPSMTYAMRETVSYRFRSDYFQSYQDVTFTVYNHASDLPSELHKMAVTFFTYGYYDANLHLVEVLILDIPKLKRAIIGKQIQPTHEDVPNPRSLQTFVGYSFESLKQHGLVWIHFKKIDGVLIPIYKRLA